MSDLGEIIASETLFGQRGEGERFPIKIGIGRPYKWNDTSPTEWVCPVEVEPFFSWAHGTHGEGSLQALCLAMREVHLRLREFIEEGGEITLENGEDFPMDAYWDAKRVS